MKKNDLTLHEYYAGLAMQGILANARSWEMDANRIAKEAVECADAMIEAFEEEQERFMKRLRDAIKTVNSKHFKTNATTKEKSEPAPAPQADPILLGDGNVAHVGDVVQHIDMRPPGKLEVTQIITNTIPPHVVLVDRYHRTEHVTDDLSHFKLLLRPRKVNAPNASPPQAETITLGDGSKVGVGAIIRKAFTTSPDLEVVEILSHDPPRIRAYDYGTEETRIIDDPSQYLFIGVPTYIDDPDFPPEA